MTQRLPVLLFALVMAVIPFIPGMPPFWLVLLSAQTRRNPCAAMVVPAGIVNFFG